MLPLSTYSTLDPKIKRIFDEISFRAVNGRLEPLYVDENNRRIGILTTSPQYPLDVNGNARVLGRLQTDTLVALGAVHLGSLDVPTTVSTKRLAVQEQANINNLNLYGTIQSGLINFNLGAWQTYTTTYGGFSTVPTSTNRFIRLGRLCIVTINVSVAGTSDATTFTLTLPFAANAAQAMAGFGAVVDNGGGLTTIGEADTVAASTTANVFKDPNGGAWVGSGNKYFNGTIIYETT